MGCLKGQSFCKILHKTMLYYAENEVPYKLFLKDLLLPAFPSQNCNLETLS